ncbi:hypothetical protein F5Y08DRAFT_337852 [Xylaria arbuscula]|nr:hypothetical protein F5Y08DRAFT_337852 [Xylaria arbuscula]
MTEGQLRGDGSRFLPLRRISPTLRPPPDPDKKDKKDKQSTSNPKRSIIPRGQRFSKLTDAYLNVTSRLAPKKATNKALEQVQSGIVDPTLSPFSSHRRARSQDELQTPNTASAMQALMRRRRGASLDSTFSLEDLASGINCCDHSAIPNKQTQNELPGSNGPSDTTSSTINRIVAQYDGSECSLRAHYNNTQEYGWKKGEPSSLPPQISLPEPPSTNTQYVSYEAEGQCDSAIADTSVTDSQHLLDPEAQAHELDQAGRTLFPPPLTITRAQHSDESTVEQHRDAQNDYNNVMVYGWEAQHTDPFAHAEERCYNTYLNAPMQRDISQELRRLSSCPGPVYSSVSHPYSPPRGVQAQEGVWSQSNVHTPSTGGRPVRDIKVVIGRDSSASKDTREAHSVQTSALPDRRNLLFPEDDDWVTEATSDVGFGSSFNAFPAKPFTLGFKKSGSSLANYSDDDYDDEGEEALYRHGSRDGIIQHPNGEDHNKLPVARRLNERKYENTFSRRQNALPGTSGLRWASAAPQTGHFRPQALGKNKNVNSYHELNNRRTNNSGRLVFNFDQNSPPRYQFRDSVSEYEPASASTKANCGTHGYDTHGSLPFPVPDIAARSPLGTPGAQFDRSAEFDAMRNPSPNALPQRKPRPTNDRVNEAGFSIYAADNIPQPEELDNREFAVASSYYDQPTFGSVRSKFNFELLPLEEAQKKNKSQRQSGDINETEPTTKRLKRKQSVRPPQTPMSLPTQPSRAFFTSPDLSETFSTPQWQTNSDLADIPTPFSDSVSESTRLGDVRRCRKINSQGTEDYSSSLGLSSPTRSLWYGHKPPCLVPAQNRRQLVLQPTLVAPDDYVSDRAATIRRSCFYILAILSILPFVGVLVLTGAFSDCLKWATRGEVDRLSSRQLRFIKWVLIVECVLYAAGVVAVVVYFVLKSQA